MWKSLLVDAGDDVQYYSHYYDYYLPGYCCDVSRSDDYVVMTNSNDVVVVDVAS